MLILDTATSVFSAALCRDGVLLGTVSGDAGPGSSAAIPGQLAALLERCRTAPDAVEAFAVTVGPGSFTGVRLGIAMVKGMAFAASRPVVPLSSLELLALNAGDSALPVCPLFDARKGEVYAALYRFDGAMTLVRPEAAIAPADLLEQVEGETLFIGDGALRYRAMIVDRLGERAIFAADHLHRPTAAAGAALADRRYREGRTVSAVDLMPRYLRLSEAELNRR